MVEIRSVFPAAEYAGRNQPGIVTKMAKQFVEQTVELVTEAAATLFDDLLVESSCVDEDRPLPMDVEILERHGQEMSSLQERECRPIWYEPRIIDTDTFEITLHNSRVYLA